jgi:2-hydroxy-6-oxonona-2,4-dienedioate hydrolase
MEDYKSIWTALVDVEFEQRWIDVDGIRTRYARAGNAGRPVVLMLHGTAGSWENFSRNMGALSKHFDCYSIDMIGCGYSDKPDVPYETAVYAAHAKGFLDAIGVEQAHLVGCSLGGWVAARLAITYPDRVASLTMVSAAGYQSDLSNMSRIKSQRTKAVDEPTWENIKPIFNNLIADEKNRIPDIIALRQGIYKKPDMARAMQNILCLQDPDTRAANVLNDEQWKSITVPALVIGSLEDKDTYLETARIVSKLMPNATYAEMPSVGHWPQFEDPETFNRLFTEFMVANQK